jgi:hypothetical protein
MRLDLSKIYAALAATAVVLASPVAHAFTIENGSSSGGGSALAPSPFNDPDKKLETDKNGNTKMQFGDTTVFMGGRDSVERDFQTGMDRMFSPLGRPSN